MFIHEFWLKFLIEKELSQRLIRFGMIDSLLFFISSPLSLFLSLSTRFSHINISLNVNLVLVHNIMHIHLFIYMHYFYK